MASLSYALPNARVASVHTLPPIFQQPVQQYRVAAWPCPQPPTSGVQHEVTVNRRHQVGGVPGPIREHSMGLLDDEQPSDDDELEEPMTMTLAEQIEEAKQQAHDARMLATRRKVASEPDGNLYRGWAVGIQGGLRQFYLTLLVIAVQVVGPVVMCIWGHLELANGEVEDIWTYMAPDCSSVTQEQLSKCDKSFQGTLANVNRLTIVLHKFLGAVLMCMLYLNGDAILDRMDRQDDRLRELYPALKKRWMFMDSFCNSWCVAMSAFATPMLIFASHEAKDLVLDAFGLLFLQSIDDYSGNIEFGIETSDFDDLIDHRELELKDEKRKQQASRGADTPSSLRHKRSVGKIILQRCAAGDYFFIMARLLNQVVGCFAVPCYLLLQWYPEGSPSFCLCEHGGNDRAKSNLEVVLWFQTPRVLILGSCILCALFVKHGYSAWVYYRTSQEDFEFLSCFKTFCQVLLSGRSDPRHDHPDKYDDVL